MNQTTYKHDYVPHNWIENNLNPNNEDFCRADNIDDCLKYISQELCVLGHPSIYNQTSSCEYAVNCDIIKLLNAIFELLNNLKANARSIEDLESRNQNLLSDVKLCNRKNAQLKDILEQQERKIRCELEKERQLKVKNDQLVQLIKNEKDESKKLQTVIQQQKVSYQHELRKYESSMNQMKTRLNQILTDKNSDKKIANISPSHLLQRNSKQRGKWKTGSAAKSSLEEMYSSIIAAYENRCIHMSKEISELHSCLEYVQGLIQNILLSSEDDKNKENKCSMEITPLKVFWNEANMQQAVNESFEVLINNKVTAFQKNEEHSAKLSKEILSLNSKVSQYRMMIDEYKENGKIEIHEDQILEHCTKPENVCVCCEVSVESEKNNLQAEKLKLTESIAKVEKEKSDIELQKLNLIRLTMRQVPPESQWPTSFGSVPSFSVMTTRQGVTVLPSANQLKQCFSAPEQRIESLTPLWKTEPLDIPEEKHLMFEGKPRNTTPDTLPLPGSSQKNALPDSDLPKWAISAISEPLSEGSVTPCLEKSSAEDIIGSTENVLDMSRSSEEQNLTLLKAAVEEIEKRRGKWVV